MPKSEREYLTLGFLKQNGIPSVEAAGWGVRWNRVGGVASCFILTVREKNTRDFRACLTRMETEPSFRNRLPIILRALGGSLQILHGQRFFLLRPNTRNILIRETRPSEAEFFFLDQPYARFLRGPASLWGQLKDLSTLLGGVLRHTDDSVIDSFFEGYLPDPLGKGPEELRRRLLLALEAREANHRRQEWVALFRALF